jgi:hypothetical protein
MNEPVAVRYDYDGNGYLYMDAGSGSDWASRVKNCEFLYTHPQKKLTDEEPIAWVYPEFMKNIKDAKCWTAYATYHKDRPIPLYTHPIRELSDDEIVLTIEQEFGKPYDKVIELCATLKNDLKISMLRNLIQAILKKASEK